MNQPSVHPHLVMVLKPTSLAAERYRNVRHLLSGRFPNQCIVIAVTSPGEGDGKTTTAINLACAMAEVPKSKVLLIDGDLRKSSMERYLGLGEKKSRRGLYEALVDSSIALEHITVRPGELNVSVVPAGVPGVHVHRAFASKNLTKLLDVARQRFDVVVVDTPPVTQVNDALALEPHVSGYIYVVSANRTPRELLVESLKDVAPEKVIGLVFNRGELQEPGLGYHRSYYKNTYAKA